MHQQSKDNRKEELKRSGKAAYLERLKKMALYDAKKYFDIITGEDGNQKMMLKSDEAIDWDILESVEVTEGKVKLKFPDRSRAMEKYGKYIMESAEGTDETTAVFLESDDEENL